MYRLGCGAWRGEIEHFRVRDEFLLQFCLCIGRRVGGCCSVVWGLGFFMNSAERLYRGRISEMSYQDCGWMEKGGFWVVLIFSP